MHPLPTMRTPNHSDESLERHVVRCPNRGMRYMMHSGLVGIHVSTLKEVEIPEMAIVIEARGLRTANASRPGDVVVLDFFAEGRHLVVDAVVTTVYRNTVF